MRRDYAKGQSTRSSLVKQGTTVSRMPRWSRRLVIGIVCLSPFAPAHAGFETILGNVDGVFQDSSSAFVVRGWACWKDAPGASPKIDLYVGGESNHGGTKLGTYESNQPNEPTVDQVCGTTNTPHRFVITLNITMRQRYAGKAIYLYGVPAFSNYSYTLLSGSGQFTVPAAPAVTDSVYYIHTDRLGSNVIMTDDKANVVAKTDYKAYGSAASNQQKNESPGYTGHYEDPLTGLTYMQQRYYDSDLGRFVSIDAAAAKPGDVFNFNRYAYASNNPLSFIDPTGMAAQAVCGNATLNQDGSWSVSGCGGGGGGGSGFVPPSVWYGGGGGRDPGAGQPNFGGGGGGGIPTERPVNVTANRPPDIARQEFFGFTAQNQMFARQFESIYAGWNRFMRLFQKGELNVSVGLGASGEVMPDYADVEAGFAFDSSPNACFYGSGSAGAGLGGIWGAAGISGGIGSGALASGNQTSYGTYWAGGEGVLGEGKISYSPGSGIGYARGLWGFSASATGVTLSGGGFVNETSYRCLR